jgi:Spinocerebellar ataxia type 10 protein domain
MWVTCLSLSHSQPLVEIFDSDLREHAIFTLRNLLENNRENQEFVHSLKPSQEWDEDGTLKTTPGAVLK